MNLVTRSELRAMATVLVVTAAVAAAFPYGATGFRATPGSAQTTASVAFVVLTPEAERTAMRIAKGAWQMDASGVRRHRARLPLGVLPEEDGFDAVTIGGRPVSEPPDDIPSGPAPLVPTMAAPAVRALAAPAVEAAERAFSRDELLKTD